MAGRAQTPANISPVPDEPVRLAVMQQTWHDLAFLHWRYDPAVVRPLVPGCIEVDTFDGAAWVGLTPFRVGARPPHAPVALSLRFPETNVRTYVKTSDGRRGVWFFSLDAGSLPAALAARTFYRLPYMWSEMRVWPSEHGIVYRCRRRWPEPNASHAIAVLPGEPYAAAELGALEHFLTARWRLYTTIGGALGVASIEHLPWPLRRATVVRLEENLVAAAGLPPPAGPPIVHFSDGVDVRIGPLLPLLPRRRAV